MIQRITFRCASGHESHLDLHGELYAYAMALAGLMDGSSPHYITPPGHHDEDDVTQIGRCQWPVQERGLFGRLRDPRPCGMAFMCTVTTIEDAP